MNRKIYESIGASVSDDWMERERRYEARHSPWDLDDNASYLDEEHRKHCEARQVRKEHERNCEVEHPDYDKYQAAEEKTPSDPQRLNPQRTVKSQKRTLNEEETFKLIMYIIAIIIIIVELFFG
ncbi:MAG: hypothetical protein K6A14_08780 [Erysipelotrichaceae bacterium]|nr:hypothetical protein [Erysipelotrichaceae bacterium]